MACALAAFMTRDLVRVAAGDVLRQLRAGRSCGMRKDLPASAR